MTIFLCAVMLLLFPAILIGSIYWGGKRWRSLPPVIDDDSGALMSRGTTALPAELRGFSVALEAQFLVAPSIAIREAQGFLRHDSVEPGEMATLPRHGLGDNKRLAFESLMREIELLQASPGHGGSSRDSART